MAFNIADAFGDLQKNTTKPKLMEIELHLIDRNPQNYYSMDGIEELADNIRMFGLMEPLIVKPTASGRWMLISGHRRRAALKQLAEEGFFPDGMHHKVDCLATESPKTLPGIEDPEKAEQARSVLEQLQLLFANSDTRKLSSADTAMQVRRIRELLTELKRLGYKLPGRVRDLVADTAKVSATRIARLDVIEKGLTDKWLRQAWKDGDLQETSAYEIARRDPEIQRLVSDRVGIDNLCDMKTEDVIICLNGCEADGNRKRETGEEAEKKSTTDTKPAIPTPSRSAEEIAAAYRESSQIEDDILRDICRRNLGNIINDIIWGRDHDFSANFRIPNIDAMKKHGNHSYCSSWSGVHEDLQWDSRGVRVRKLMDEDDNRSWVIFNRSWTDFYDALSGAAMQQARQTPEKPKRSTVDTPEWHRDPEPPQDGRYLCLVDMNTRALHEQRCDWRDGHWYAYGIPLQELFTVLAWWPLPKEAPRPKWWDGLKDLEEDEEE